MAERDKLDAPSRHLLSELSDAEAQEDVRVLLRARTGFTGPQLEALRADGARIDTVAGDVATATVAAASLPSVAAHDFVVQVQLSSALRPDAPDQVPPSYDVE